jgi:hypothetical protein
MLLDMLEGRYRGRLEARLLPHLVRRVTPTDGLLAVAARERIFPNPGRGHESCGDPTR